MIKLKGGDEGDKHSIMNSAARRMGMPQLNGQKSNNAAALGSAGAPSGPGSFAAGSSIGSSSSSSSADPSARLGLPRHRQARTGKDWAEKSNRINMGGPVFIRGAREGNGAPGEEAEDSEDSEYDGGDALAGEDSTLMAQLRERRLAELKKQAQKHEEFLILGHGSYIPISEDEFLPSVTQSKYAVCQFFHSAFERCKIIDKHMDILAKRHIATRFFSLNAEKAPFFVKKLQVKTLPTIVLFKDGIAVDRIIGFEDLGGSDDFETAVLEKRIAKSGVIITVDKVSSDEKESAAEARRKAASKIREAKIQQFIQGDSDESDEN